MSYPRTKGQMRAEARAATSIKTDRAIILRQRDLLWRWIEVFGDYCTTAESGKLYKNTKEALR